MSYAASSTATRADTSTSVLDFNPLNKTTMVSHLSRCKINRRSVFPPDACNFIYEQMVLHRESFNSFSSTPHHHELIYLSASSPFQVYLPLQSKKLYIFSIAECLSGRDKKFYPAVKFPEGNSVAMIVTANTKNAEAELEMTKTLTQCDDASPYLVQLFTSHVSKNSIIWTMPLYSALDLFQLVNTTRFLKRAPLTHLKLVRDILLGIGYLHQKGYIHGDIKPENIFIHAYVNTRNKICYQAKLGDFGETIPQDSPLKILTRGTPAYFATEMQKVYEIHFSYFFKIDENTPRDEIPPKLLEAVTVITTKIDMQSLHFTLTAIFVRLFAENHPHYRGASKRFWIEFQKQSPLQATNPKKRPSVEDFLPTVHGHIRTERMKKHNTENRPVLR